MADCVTLNVDTFACVICHEVKLKNMCPIVCMHNTCMACYDSIRISDTRCPVCRDTAHWIKNTFVNRIVGDMKIKCGACAADVERRNMEEHQQKVCPSRLVNCGACPWLGRAARLAQHEHACQYQTVTCVHCLTEIHHPAAAAHRESCTFRTATCAPCGTSYYLWQGHMCRGDIVAFINDELTKGFDAVTHRAIDVALAEPGMSDIQLAVNHCRVINEMRGEQYITAQLARVELAREIHDFYDCISKHL